MHHVQETRDFGYGRHGPPHAARGLVVGMRDAVNLLGVGFYLAENDVDLLCERFLVVRVEGVHVVRGVVVAAVGVVDHLGHAVIEEVGAALQAGGGARRGP